MSKKEMVVDSSESECFKILVFFRNFNIFFKKYDLTECICLLFLSDECVDDFRARHKATAKQHTGPFDSCIMNH